MYNEPDDKSKYICNKYISMINIYIYIYNKLDENKYIQT